MYGFVTIHIAIGRSENVDMDPPVLVFYHFYSVYTPLITSALSEPASTFLLPPKDNTFSHVSQSMNLIDRTDT